MGCKMVEGDELKSRSRLCLYLFSFKGVGGGRGIVEGEGECIYFDVICCVHSVRGKVRAGEVLCCDRTAALGNSGARSGGGGWRGRRSGYGCIGGGRGGRG